MQVPVAMPWWRSKVIVGAGISIILKVLVLTGLTQEIAPADQTQIIDLVMLVISGIGDLVAIGARVTQKYAPAIRASGPTRMGANFVPMLAMALVLPLALAGCASFNPGEGPRTYADQTLVDEQAGYAITTAYTAAAEAASLAIETGLVTDPEAITRIGQLNDRAYAFVLGVRQAYEAGNSTDYVTALREARMAIDDLVAAVSGARTEGEMP